jgi:hypothetical protein
MDEIVMQQYVEQLIEELGSRDGALGIRPNEKWWRDIPSTAGVYAVYEGSLLIYVGETADLRERMRDFGDTRHHTLSRSVGHAVFLSAQIFKGLHQRANSRLP